MRFVWFLVVYSLAAIGLATVGALLWLENYWKGLF